MELIPIKDVNWLKIFNPTRPGAYQKKLQTTLFSNVIVTETPVLMVHETAG